MKYVIIAVIGIIVSISGQAQGQKKALLIGVGKYAPGSRWTSLSSANDIAYLREAIRVHGFTDSQVKVLIDSQATKAGILAALTHMAENAGKGDILFVHFSGHGQQIQDQTDNKKDEIDGYDEALIPHDVMSGIRSTSYKGEKHLRDDEIQPLLAKMRRNVGSTGSVFITIDACHSGTATRSADFAIARGTPIPFQEGGYDPPKNFTIQQKRDDGFYDDDQAGGNMVFFSASSPDQVNYETVDNNKKGVGSLSFALAKALLELPAGSTYDLLFHKVRSEIQGNFPMQVPMLEGNGSQLIFQDKFVRATNIIKYNFKDNKNDSTIYIKQGSVQGISVGSKFSLSSASTKKPEAFGEIISVSPFESLGIITSRADNKKLDQRAGYVFGWEYINYASTATYKIKNNVPVDLYLKQISRLIDAQSFLEPSDNADFLVEISKKEDGTALIEVVEKGDFIRWSATLTMPDSLSEEQKLNLLDGMRMAMQAKTLRNLPNGGELVNGVKVDLISSTATFDNTGAAKTYETVMKPRDEYTLKLKNTGKKRVYFTIINILPDNFTQVLLPYGKEKPEEFFLDPGDSSTINPGFQIDNNPIPGKEVLRVFFTPEPVDLRPVFNRDVATKGKHRGQGEVKKVENVLNDLIQTSYSGTRTRSARAEAPVSDLGILTVGFIIEKQ